MIMYIKYIGKWFDPLHNEHELQILTNDAVDVVEEIKIITCNLEHPDNHILSDSVLNGCGGEISFISPSRLYFSELYTENYLKYQIKHFINNELVFFGYLDSEQYNDKISSVKNYEISFKYNDGISLLERIKYNNGDLVLTDSYIATYVYTGSLFDMAGDVNITIPFQNGDIVTAQTFDGDKLSGVVSRWSGYPSNFFGLQRPLNEGEMILGQTYNWIRTTNIENTKVFDSAFNIIHESFKKLNIQFNSINICLSTTIPNTTITETLLHTIHCNKGNYIDEKNISMTCREVINGILLPLSAKLYIFNNQIWIIDINSLLNPVFRRYSFVTGSYIDIISTKNTHYLNNLYNGDESVELENGKNQINLKFSKYSSDNTSFDFDVDDCTNLIRQVVRTNPEGDKFREYAYSDCSKYNKHPNQTVEYVNVIDADDNTTNYIRFKPTVTRIPEAWDINLTIEGEPAFSINTGIYLTSSDLVLKIEFDYMIENINRYGEEYKERLGDWSQGIATNQTVADYTAIGFFWDNKYVNTNYVYITGTETSLFSQTIQNKWYKAIQHVPLNNDYWIHDYSFTGGELILKYNAHCAKTGLNYCMKNIKILICDKKSDWDSNNSNAIFKEKNIDDSETIGYLNDNFKDDIDIELIHGTDNSSLSRGAYLIKVNGLYNDSKYAINERITTACLFNRAGQSSTIEKLLLNTYLSNYEQSRYVLNCTIRETPRRIRYIRDWMNGSNINYGNHWIEIKAHNINGNNVAFSKPVYSNFTVLNSQCIVDNVTTVYYADVDSSYQDAYIMVDLGAIYDINEVVIWHYYYDSRYYNNTKTEVSTDGVTWFTLFDSATQGVYQETAEGRTYKLGRYYPFDVFNYPLLKRNETVSNLIPISITTDYVTNYTTYKLLEFECDKLNIQNG